MRRFYASVSEKRIAFKKTAFFLLINLLLAANTFADYTVPVGQAINASTITGQSGVLTINGTLNVDKDIALSAFTTVILNAPAGQIFWVKNYTLTFAEGTNIVINTGAPGLQPVGGSAAQVLQIGTTIVSVSNDNSNKGDFSFTQFNSQGGLPQYTITSNAPVCAGTALNFGISPNKVASGISYTYKWTISPISGTFSPNNTNASVSITPAAGDYTVTCVATAKGSGDAYEVVKNINVSVRLANTWLGITSTWNDSRNWCPGIPTVTSNITVPATANNPVIPQGVFAVDDITIAAGASLTVNGTLQIAGKLVNGGTLDATKGTIELNGAQAQTISGSSFVRRTLNNLIISNKAGVNLSATTNDTLNVTGTLSFGTSNATLNTYDNLTLKSNASATANIADVTNSGTLTGNKIIGKVTVERFLNIGGAAGQHGKGWVFLATPTNGQSVRESWMENGATTSNGYGVQITGPGGIPAGFDMASSAPSMKYFDYKTNNWVGVANANSPIYDGRGYMIFVRGDRSVDGIKVTAATNTTLRTKGNLFTGDTTINLPGNSSFYSIGNPYAAAIDMRKIGADFFYLWNSSLGGTYGYGAYETYMKRGSDYYSVPGNKKNNFIESGQAFFVQTGKTPATLVLKEASKANSGNVQTMRTALGAGNVGQLSTDLYTVAADGTTALADGVFQEFSDDYSNVIDERSARKIFNSNENVTIKKAGVDLVVERRNYFQSTDTMFLSLTGLKAQNYRLEFNAGSLANGLQAYLEDAYLKTSTPLNMDGLSQIDFVVINVPVSYASNRFQIVFKKVAAPLPVTFASVSASKKGEDIIVEWKTENESNLKQFEVEKSIDGNRFTTVATIAAGNKSAGAYNWLDKNAASGYNYYRIRSVDIDGKTAYTQIVKVQIEKNVIASITVYPNPAVNNATAVQLTNQPKGIYYVRLVNPIGQVVLSKQVAHNEGNSTVSLQLNNKQPQGIYQLEITRPDGGKNMMSVVF